MALVHPGVPSALDFSSSAMLRADENGILSNASHNTNTVNLAMLQAPPSAAASSGVQTLRPPHRQIHRNRASYSCHSCRRRKVKCDRQHPTCGNCSKMAETCVYSDNTGKGAKNKNKDRLAAAAAAVPPPSSSSSSSSSSPSASSSSTEIAGSPPKRMRTNSAASGSISGSDDDSCSYRSHSRASSMNQSDFNALNSPFQSPAQLQMTLPAPPPPPPPPADLLSAIIKEGELETRVNRLAEIVDQWYKVAYSHGQQPGSPPPGFVADAVDGAGNRRWPAAMQEQHARSQGLPSRPRKQSTPEYTPRSSPVLGRPRVHKSSAHTRPRASTISSTHFASCKDGGAEDVAMGHLSIQENGRSRYVGTSFWALLSNEITDLNQVLKSTNKSEAFNSAPASTPPPSTCTPPPETDGIFRAYGNIDSTSGKDVLSILHSIPSRKHCEMLYSSFLAGVNPIMPLIHVPSFNAEWRGFWTWFPENTHTLPAGDLLDNPTFIPLLLAILYAGAVSMSAKTIGACFDGRSKDVVVNHLLAATTSALAATSFPRSPTINSLIAFLIVQTCQIREEEPLASCSFIGTAMRIAQQMGLHRDGSLFNLGEVECEVRRRVWWHIMHLDIQGAIASGLPPLGGSSEDQFDTKMVSELSDEFVGCEPSDSSDANQNSPAMILAVGRYETAQLLRKIIVRLLGIKPPRKADIAEMSQMILELKGKLEERIARIPARGLPEMGFIPHEEVDGAEREGIFNSWARIMLSMMSDRAYGVLYQPFLKSTKSKMWLQARHCALRSAHSFLRSYIHLSRSPLFAPYQWYCPGTYQPLHATMILLLDLHERPLAAEAPRSRVFVDEIFSLFADHPGEAWHMLGRLRRRAEMVAKSTANNSNANNSWGGATEIGWEFEEWATTAAPAPPPTAEHMQQQQQQHMVVMPDQQMDMMLMPEEFDWNSVFVEVDGNSSSTPRTVGQVEQVDMNGTAAGWALLECAD